MRTEVKIGIVVGLIIVAGAVFFFVQQGRQAGRNVTDVLPVDAPAERVTGPAPRVTPPRPAVTTPPAGERRPALPLAQRPSGVEPARTPPAGGPLTTGSPAYVPPRPTGPEVTTAAPTTQVTPSADLPPLVTTSPPAGSAIPESGSPVAPPPTITRPEAEVARTPSPGVALPPRGETPATTLIPPPPTTRTPLPAAGGQKHTIENNDSLWAIAMKYYDDGGLWPRIKAANPGLDENRLLVGQTIIIPPKEGAAAAAPAGPGAARPSEAAREPSRTTTPPPATTETGTPAVARSVYVVEQGDSLISIARNVLGDGTRWREIYELNKSKIPNPDILYVGLKLQLPERNPPATPARRPAGR